MPVHIHPDEQGARFVVHGSNPRQLGTSQQTTCRWSERSSEGITLGTFGIARVAPPQLDKAVLSRNFRESAVQIAIRHYFSLNHLATASVMARQCAEIESVEPSSLDWAVSNQTNQACAISALIASVAFLEATINEVFSDCADGTSACGQPFPNAGLLASLWTQGIPRTASYSVIEKYQIALTLAGKEQMPTNRNPAQDVDALVFARNYLIHFEPEFVRSTNDSEKAKFQRIHSRLRNKFDLNRLVPENCMFFPEKVLGAGCAKWAASTAIAFTDHFFRSVGVRATYDHLRGESPYNFLSGSARP